MSFMRIILAIFLIIGPAIGWTQQDSLPKEELNKKLKRQETMIRRIQILIGEINQRQNVMEQSLPPVDLLESLYADQKQIQEGLKNMVPRIVSLEDNLNKLGSNQNGNVEESLIRGVLAMLAGNPDAAFDHFNPLLIEETPKKLKHDLLMALGHAYMLHGYPEQAASHFGTAIDLSRKGPQYPHALFYLGLTFQMLDDVEKRNVIWAELSGLFPLHPLSLKALKMKDHNETNASSRLKQKKKE